MQEVYRDGTESEPQLLSTLAVLQKQTIDEALAKKNVSHVKIFKVGRNDMCSCKSGRKFKHCCINK